MQMVPLCCLRWVSADSNKHRPSTCSSGCLIPIQFVLVESIYFLAHLYRWPLRLHQWPPALLTKQPQPLLLLLPPASPTAIACCFLAPLPLHHFTPEPPKSLLIPIPLLPPLPLFPCITSLLNHLSRSSSPSHCCLRCPSSPASLHS